MSFPHGETVTRIRAAVVSDPYSGEASRLDWDAANSVDIEGCAFGMAGRARDGEPLADGRDQVVATPVVYAPPGADVTARDRLVVRGLVYEVDGEPFEWRSPFTGWRPGLEIPCKRAEG